MIEFENPNGRDQLDIIHLVVGPSGNFSESINPKDFAKAVIQKLEGIDGTEEAIYFDPYLLKALTQDKSGLKILLQNIASN